MNFKQKLLEHRNLVNQSNEVMKEISNHPRVKEWIDYYLRPRPYFGGCLEEIYLSDNTLIMQYWCQSGTDWESIPLSVLESDEPIVEYYQRLKDEEEEKTREEERKYFEKQQEKRESLKTKSKEELLEILGAN